MRARKDGLSAQQTTPLAAPQGGPHRSDTPQTKSRKIFVKYDSSFFRRGERFDVAFDEFHAATSSKFCATL